MLKFNLIKYGSLTLKFKKPIKQTNKYLRDLRKDKKERAYIRLHNRQNYFIKEYKGDPFLIFKKIPPGNYQITVDNISEKYLYSITSNKIKICPGKNILTVKKAHFNRPQLNLKEKPENLKIKD
jgi:hypothetical protein